MIRSSAPADFSPGFGFKSWRYARVKVNINPDQPDAEDDACADTDCEASLIDRPFLAARRPNYAKDVIRKANPLKVNGIDAASLATDEYIPVEFTIPEEVDDAPAKTRFTRHLHIVDGLKANILLGNDILELEKMVPNINKST